MMDYSSRYERFKQSDEAFRDAIQRLNRDVVTRVVERVDLGGLPFKIKLRVVDDDVRGIGLRCTLMDVPNRDALAEAIDVSQHGGMPCGIDRVVNEDDVLELVRQLVLDLVKHELSEHFRIDGRRPFDPHLEKQPIAFSNPVFGLLL